MFRRLGVPEDLRMIVEGESIANDGVAIVLFGIALAVASGSANPGVGGAALHVLLAVAGGCAVGALAAAALALDRRAHRGPRSPRSRPRSCSRFSPTSAPRRWASPACSRPRPRRIVDARRGRASYRGRRGREDINAFWSAVAFVANAFVFLFTGLTLQLSRIGHEPLLVAVAVVATVLSRALLAAAVDPPARAGPWRCCWRAMRGGLSLALALSIAEQTSPSAAQIIDAVFGVVFFTLVVQGLALGPAVRRLRTYSWCGGPPLSS